MMIKMIFRWKIGLDLTKLCMFEIGEPLRAANFASQICVQFIWV